MDSNDDLLEDGDLSETNFDELDLAEEDALLADDEEKPHRHLGTTEEKTEDDDYIQLGVDEDLNLIDEDGLENGSIQSTRQPIEINSHDNDDSDENTGRERDRFKSERKLTSTTTTTRNAAAIPETLDAVAVRNPVKINTKGGNRGGGKAGGKGVGQNRKFGRNHPNIHVNPHFRPRLPMGGPYMWNGGFHNQPPPYHQPHPPPYGPFQPPGQPPQWNEQGGYYNGPPGQHFNQPQIENNYYGSDDGFYSNQQNYPPPPPPLPQPQMGWGDNFYQGPPANYQPPPPHFPPGPNPMMGPPRMRPPFPMGPRPPFNQNKHNFQGKPPPSQQGKNQNWGGGPVRPPKREPFHNVPKAPPAKQPKFDNTNPRTRSNLEEVKMVDCLPPEAVAEEEDEEMKAYRKKIEEQKKLREKILKEKEEKRLVAAQQKALQTAAATSPGSKPQPPATSPTIPAGPPQIEKKTVRIRGPDGKLVVKQLTLEEIKKLKKVPVSSNPVTPSVSEVPSRVVCVENLSASTTQRQLEALASRVGPIEKVELNSAKKTAIIRFIRLESAKEFLNKYQRKMVDLSMIGVKFVKID